MELDHCIRIDEERRLWLMEISRQTFEDQAVDDLESDDGLFLVLESGRQLEILAKAASFAAGQAMMTLFSSRMSKVA